VAITTCFHPLATFPNWAPAFAGVEVEWVLESIEWGVAMYEAVFRSLANAGGQESRAIALLGPGPRFRGGTEEERALVGARYAGIEGSNSRNRASIALEYW
jgi:hypothetical protein